MVSKENIIEAAEKINAMEEGALEKHIEGVTLRQEQLTAFNISTALEFQNDAVAQYSMYYFAVLFEAFEKEYNTLKVFGEDEINSYLEGQFYPALDQLFKEQNETAFRTTVQEDTVLDFLTYDLGELKKSDDKFDDQAFSQLFILTSALTGLMHEAAV